MLVFTSEGVGVGVVIRHVELYLLCSDSSDSTYDSVVYNKVKTGSSESQAEEEELNQLQSLGIRKMCIVIGLSLPLLLPNPTIWFSLDDVDHKRNRSDRDVSRVGRKWKCSDSFDSDSVALMTLFTTPTPSQVKTSL